MKMLKWARYVAFGLVMLLGAVGQAEASSFGARMRAKLSSLLGGKPQADTTPPVHKLHGITAALLKDAVNEQGVFIANNPIPAYFSNASKASLAYAPKLSSLQSDIGRGVQGVILKKATSALAQQKVALVAKINQHLADPNLTDPARKDVRENLAVLLGEHSATSHGLEKRESSLPGRIMNSRFTPSYLTKKYNREDTSEHRILGAARDTVGRRVKAIIPGKDSAGRKTDGLSQKVTSGQTRTKPAPVDQGF